MKLIRSIRITNFRSCKNVHLDNVTDFTALMGVNNTGKSNILRAIKAFFSNEVEDGIPVDVKRDSNVTAGKKKEFSVEVKLVLPKNFNFHPLLKQAAVDTELFGPESGGEERQIWIRRRWRYDPGIGGTVNEFNCKKREEEEYERAEPDDYDKQIQIEARGRKIQRFLDLINLTYIPSHRDPILIIENAQPRLRDYIIQRYKHIRGVREAKTRPKGTKSTKAKEEEALLKGISEAAGLIMKPIIEQIKKVFSDISDLKVKTPTDLHDIALDFKYEAYTRARRKIEFDLQGSGFQTELMFLIQELIDTAYFLDFGWKEATIWCLEEPESFLHWDLEGELGNFLRSIAEDSTKKLQIISSTHSGVIALNAFNGYFLSTVAERGYTSADEMIPAELVHQSYSTGVTGLIHALILHKYSPLVFVEGVSDELILSKASQKLGLSPAGAITSLTSLEKDPDLGGGNTILSYLKRQSKLVKVRSPEARLIVVIDPDKKGNKTGIDNFFEKNHPSSKCYVLNSANHNPELDPESFKGIEQFLSTRLIELGEKEGIIKLAEPRLKGKVKYVLQNLAEFRDEGKVDFAELVVREGVKEDFSYLEPELKIIKNLSEGKPGGQLNLPSTKRPITDI